MRCTVNSGHTITLQPLPDLTAVRLVGQLLGDDPSLAGLADRIAVAAVGNPFFVEEIVRDLAGRGALSGGRGRYRLISDVDEIAVPATVQAVLAARIDRLPAESKSILNAAAVIGTHFDVDTLHALLPEAASARSGRAGVGRVDRSDGIRPSTTVLLPPSAGSHGRLRIAVEFHPGAGPPQAGRRH